MRGRNILTYSISYFLHNVRFRIFLPELVGMGTRDFPMAGFRVDFLNLRDRDW
jgi:hypothetical protein